MKPRVILQGQHLGNIYQLQANSCRGPGFRDSSNSQQRQRKIIKDIQCSRDSVSNPCLPLISTPFRSTLPGCVYNRSTDFNYVLPKTIPLYKAHAAQFLSSGPVYFNLTQCGMCWKDVTEPGPPIGSQYRRTISKPDLPLAKTFELKEK